MLRRTVAGCVDGFQLELSSFAHQTFARQHGQYALLWRVLDTILSSCHLPVVPNLAAPFILAMNDSFSNHRRFREQMLQGMGKSVRAALAMLTSNICDAVSFATHSMYACHACVYPQSVMHAQSTFLHGISFL